MYGGASLRQAIGALGGEGWPTQDLGQRDPWPAGAPNAPMGPLSLAAERTRAALNDLGEAAMDTLHVHTQLPVSDLVAAVLELELCGLATRLASGRIVGR